MRLKESRCVTGGAQGIGRAITLGLGREAPRLSSPTCRPINQSVAEELSIGNRGHAAEVNVANESSVKGLASHVRPLW
jgi:NAD(P)-dependent dehydrogenase (short-subunit alcohol dehydrogenase family)